MTSDAVAQKAESHRIGNSVDVDDLQVSFTRARSLSGPSTKIHVLNGVTFSIAPGETLGLVGESGSGKSTTGRALLRLIPVDGGTITVAGHNFTAMSERSLRPYRRHIQMVFQDPQSSLDPSMTLSQVIEEPLRAFGRTSRAERRQRVTESLESVRLPTSFAHRYPYELSGGQRQRIAIARALAIRPDIVVLDEAVSALDVSTQGHIIDLLRGLQQDTNTAYLFISHDLSVVSDISDRVAVMYLGEIVETGSTTQVLNDPRHPYTEALVSAVPVADPNTQRERKRIVLAGEVPDPASRPTGCSFHGRCPYVMDVCREVSPGPTPTEQGGFVRCHLHEAGVVEFPRFDGHSVIGQNGLKRSPSD